MAATAATTWFWSDWLGDQCVRRLTPTERGVWIDLLALMATGSPVGYACDEKGRALSMEEIARVTNAGSAAKVSKLIDEIVDKGAASRDADGLLYNRRMVRDAERNALKRTAGLKGAASTREKWLALQNLPGQKPRQTTGRGPPRPPRQECQAPFGAHPSNKISITSTSSVAPRGNIRDVPVDQLYAAIVAKSEQAQPKQGPEGQSKSPSTITKAEFEDRLAEKRKGTA